MMGEEKAVLAGWHQGTSSLSDFRRPCDLAALIRSKDSGVADALQPLGHEIALACDT